MRQYLIPVLLLSAVALSSNNVAAISVKPLNKETVDLDGQYNDNIFRKRYQTKNALNEMFFKLYTPGENKPEFDKLQLAYADTDNNRDTDILSIYSKNNNYNWEGFRKEQWHNYPRQLDRLHKVDEQNNEKRNYDTDLTEELYGEEVASDYHDINDVANEPHLQSNTGTNNVYDTVMAADPLLVLNDFASINRDVDNADIQYPNMMTSELGSNNLADDENNKQIRNDNPIEKVMKVKREGVSSTQNKESIDNASREKRIFSLWSRLQSLNHKGHELQHRRHLHAFYGLPDGADSGGILTAETRATLMRPLGSPLRWG